MYLPSAKMPIETDASQVHLKYIPDKLPCQGLRCEKKWRANATIANARPILAQQCGLLNWA